MPADVQLLLVARLLRRGRDLGRLSDGLTLLAMGLGLYVAAFAGASPGFALGMALLVLLGLAQKCYALRVALDADLFEALAAPAETLAERTERLDQGLGELLGLPAEKAGRSWPQRSRGALRLLRWQALLCAAQWLAALLCLLTLALTP
ncbi:hypothetical protein SAMN05216189_1012147 [Pseudomonas delhiensis]|uniref:Uncharacterized protein n=1 Tax=Pseudomonas delhiensis TaxID=366289 RepID=A0A239G2N1_9PSED|nr:hypothetical protein [Pseudomonas delhiensis]SDJ10256.1 hypothetical protein SAMN05216189_1012147 [Pseudomonas delhiensis]SNS63225.1 hypothetical protein SAMN06295949_104196 [Pseudomonas delhiensis]